jgi:hypothetical protein
MLFFPDQVKARPHTGRFEVHLMVTEPLGWIEPFVEGRDGFILFRLMKNPGEILRVAKSKGRYGRFVAHYGVFGLLAPYWSTRHRVRRWDAVGIKGASMDARTGESPPRSPNCREGVEDGNRSRWRNCRETVPLISAAGAIDRSPA